MIEPPFKAMHGQSGIWLEDSKGVTVCDMNPLIEPVAALIVAETLAKGTNYYLQIADRARESGKLGGRPRKKLKKASKKSISKPSAKRHS